ncbi:MAG: hypothetical protein A2Y78_04785 [Acidobacteria bacterium RBG_13_68_16]|nr:MAG: hypothetical protein A2Y78_04785 [Acidobacteria bacterium RBG_13_68_16]
MQLSPTRILHSLAGAPSLDGCAPLSAPCAICGLDSERGMPWSRWQGTQFTDQNKIARYGSDAICEPCAWVHSWVAPPGIVLDPAKPKGPNLRMYSHFWSEADGYWCGNKADKARMRAWVLAPKSGAWFAAIADTGQKHVLPYTPLNRGAVGRVRFEEQTVILPVGDGGGLVAAMCSLLTAGPTKEEVGQGDYWVRSWRENEREIRAFERQWGSLRRRAWWTLALWLAQRDEDEHGRRREARQMAASNGRRPPGDTGRVPRAARHVAAEALGSAAGPDAGCQQASLFGGAVGDGAEP